MSDLTLTQLEKYILSDDKVAALKEVTPYTANYYFLELMNEFQCPTKTEEELESLVKNFLKNSRISSEMTQIVNFKHQLSKINSVKQNPQELKKWLDEFNKQFLNVSFEYPNFTKGNLATGLSAQQDQQTKSALSEQDHQYLSLQDLLERIYQSKDRNELNKLNIEYYNKIDLIRFNLDTDSHLIEQILQNIPEINQIPNLIELLCLHKEKYPNKNFITDCIWPRLDLSNRETLLNINQFKLNPLLLINYVIDKFDINSLEDVNKPDSERLEGWKALYEYFKTLPDKYAKYSSLILLKILDLQYSKDIINESQFLEYLKNPLGSCPGILTTKAVWSQNNTGINRYADIIGFSQNVNETQLINKYLMKLLPETTKFDTYLEYFDEKFLWNIAATSKLLKGLPVSNVENIFTADNLNELHTYKTLELLNNPNKYGSNEKVILKLNLKNISKLDIRVFEINTCNYLLDKRNDDYDSIDVTGLIPLEEYTHNYNQVPVILHSEEFEFDSITSKSRGVFVVDFIGGELNSRAIIHKGSLTIVNDSQTGRNCMIVDQNGKVCNGRETGLYIGNTFFAADSSTGIISIPLNIASISEKVVVMNDGFAALTYLKINDPQPNLNINVIYNSESFITGNQVDLIVQTKLTMNDQLVSASKLTNTVVTVTTITIEGVQNQNSFKDLKLRDTEDLVLNFMFPPKVQAINVEMVAQIKVGNENKTVNASQSFAIDNSTDDIVERFYFRKNTQEELFLEVLGRNGEPVPNVTVLFEIQLKFTSQPSVYQLISDVNGRIQIGNIKHLQYLIARGTFGEVRYVEANKKSSIYPSKIQIIENESIDLPFYDRQQKVIFYELLPNGMLKSDITSSHLEYSENKIKLSGLKAGNYSLQIEQKTININVIKGDYYELNGQNIKTSNSIIPLPKVSEVLVSETKRSLENEVYVELTGDQSTIRAHLLTFNYVPTETLLIEHQRSQSNDFANSQNRPAFTMDQKSNVYKSGKRLSDEIIYVYDRQNKPSFMGNTLEKPGMLIKRNKISETTENAPQINQGSDFNQNIMASRCGAPMREHMMLGRQMEGRFGNMVSGSAGIRVPSFVSKPGAIYSNLTLTNNRIELPKNVFDNHCYAILVLTDGNLSKTFEVLSHDSDISKADCRLKQSKKAGYIIQYERCLTGIPKEQWATVKNIKNTQICIIDDLNRLYETLKLLIENNSADFKEWEFIKQWNTMEPMEKLRKYDKYASHELNLFLYNKDREFFDEVVAVLIQNKKEKQFIDHYLLGNQSQLSKYYDFSSFKKLNKLELALLAQVSASSMPDFSASIIKYLKSSSVLQKISESRKSAIFDSLLSSKGEKVDFAESETSRNFVAQSAPMNFAHMSNFSAPPVQMMQTFAAPQQPQMRRAMPQAMNRAMPRGESLRYDSMAFGDVNYLDSQNLIMEAKIFNPTQGTIEYNERQYWKMDLRNEISAFWSELAEHLATHNSSNNFLSKSFIYSAITFSDCIAMMTFMDLSFERIKYTIKMVENDLTLVSPNNMLLFSKEIIETQGEHLNLNVLCAQKFFDPQNRFVYDDEDPTLKVDKQVDEFIVNKVYGSRIVITNCTSSDLNLNITHEIPQGAIPIGQPDFLKINKLVFGSLQSQVLEFQFYFPVEGNFTIYPATVSKGSRIIANAQVDPIIEVKKSKTIKNLETINDILSMGSTNDILDFVRTKNILNNKIFEFRNIYWLLHNQDFYQQFLTVLRSKGIYEEVVWSFSLYHADIPTLKEYLKNRAHAGNFGFIKYVKDEFICLDRFEIKEYYPLINPRAHSIGSEKVNILNNSFKKTYMFFLNYLLEKGKPTSEDWLLFSNYLMAQDRFEEAIAVFKRVDLSEAQDPVTTKIQKDYLTAYINFVSGYPDFKIAKRICEEYLVYPVLSWRNLFIEMANQLAEFEESELIQSAIENKEAQNKNSNKVLKLPNFNAELESGKLKIVAQNVSEVKIEYFKIDIEVLFSLNPFSFEQNKAYSHVKPFADEKMTLSNNEDYGVYYHAIPDNINKENLFIQISLNEKGVSKSQFLSYVPFSLNYQLNQDFGIVKLVDPLTKKPLPKIYVKCFVKYKNGNVAFYKDGYTDLRGSFDYVSLNKDQLDDVEKFSLLISAGEKGCKIIEGHPPKKIGRVEGEAKQLVSQNWSNLQQMNVAKAGLSKYNKLI